MKIVRPAPSWQNSSGAVCKQWMQGHLKGSWSRDLYLARVSVGERNLDENPSDALC